MVKSRHIYGDGANSFRAILHQISNSNKPPLGEAYFVEDGNHRVSVARYQGVRWIDAEVVELRSPIPAAWRNEVCPVCFDTAA